MTKPKVVLARCDEYDADRITEIVRKGMEEMDIHPTGRTVIKPNIVIAHDFYFPHAYTKPEFTEGIVRATRERAEDLKSLEVAERCGITLPTRMAYREAGYYKMAKRVGVDLVHLEEVLQVEIELKHPDRLRDFIYTPETIATCDFMISAPKFKAHPWTTVTFALKNWIGIQDDRHRLIDHDFNLNRKISDLHEIITPHFIAIDGIIGGQDRMLTPTPFDLGLIIMGNNAVAIDAVCCHIIGLDPAGIDHVRYCHERGLGPIDLDEIEISGDLTLEDAKRKAKGFRSGLIRVEDYFKDTPITAYAGPPGMDSGCEYCWGGCPGAMEESIEIVRKMQPDVYEKMRPIHVVFGHYEGEIDAKPGEKVLFFGDCTKWKGELNGTEVAIENQYVSGKLKNPRNAKMRDTFIKMLVVFVSVIRRRKKPHIRVAGCPVSVAEQVLYISRVGKTRNPYFDPRIVIPFVSTWISWRVRSLFRRLRLIPYQRKPQKQLTS